MLLSCAARRPSLWRTFITDACSSADFLETLAYWSSSIRASLLPSDVAASSRAPSHGGRSQPGTIGRFRTCRADCYDGESTGLGRIPHEVRNGILEPVLLELGVV